MLARIYAVSYVIIVRVDDSQLPSIPKITNPWIDDFYLNSETTRWAHLQPSAIQFIQLSYKMNYFYSKNRGYLKYAYNVYLKGIAFDFIYR